MEKQEVRQSTKRITEVDRSSGLILFRPKPAGPPRESKMFYTRPAKDVFPNEAERAVAVDAAENYLRVKQEEHRLSTMKAVFFFGVFIGMLALYGLEIVIGVF